MDNNIEKAKALFFDALALFERSNYEAAEIKLGEALTFAPTSVSILTNLAIALQRQGKYAEARTHAERDIALYSEIARRDIVLAQRLVATRGYRATADDIRKCRAEIIDSPVGSRLRNVVAAMDFFSLDECRDLLFHVQEHRFTIPQIASFLADNDLDFIGFELEPQVRVGYLRSFSADTGMTNLSNWHEYETKHPDTCFGMYNFWVRRRGAVWKP